MTQHMFSSHDAYAIQGRQLQVNLYCSIFSIFGLLLGTEAPIMTPNGVDFSSLYTVHEQPDDRAWQHLQIVC